MSKRNTAETRDLNEDIRNRNGAVKVAALRKVYGEHFAQDYSDDTKLETVLYKAGTRTLSEYMKRR